MIHRPTATGILHGGRMIQNHEFSLALSFPSAKRDQKSVDFSSAVHFSAKAAVHSARRLPSSRSG
jgi:hypothetical protein